MVLQHSPKQLNQMGTFLKKVKKTKKKQNRRTTSAVIQVSGSPEIPNWNPFEKHKLCPWRMADPHETGVCAKVF